MHSVRLERLPTHLHRATIAQSEKSGNGKTICPKFIVAVRMILWVNSFKI